MKIQVKMTARDIFDFSIDQEDMDLLDTLNQNYRSASIPEDLRDVAF